MQKMIENFCHSFQAFHSQNPIFGVLCEFRFFFWGLETRTATEKPECFEHSRLKIQPPLQNVCDGLGPKIILETRDGLLGAATLVYW